MVSAEVRTNLQVEQGNPNVVPRIRIRNLTKRFHSRGQEVVAVDNVSLDVAPGEIVVLLGPSGCGKTTLLRCVAGLEHAEEGEVEINGSVVFSSRRRVSLAPERRRISMVFQSYALWPHMSVFDNVAYPLRSRRVNKGEIRDRVQAALDKVGCGHLLSRYPGQLSGGQQQRVALARAIVAGDGVILFDEPLSNVDAKVREQLRIELLAMHRDLRFSALYVTHDQTEATVLADRIAVMNSGRTVQVGPPREIYERPTSRYVAEFIGTANTLEGVVEDCQGDRVSLQTSAGQLMATAGLDGLTPGQKVVVVIRPEHCFMKTGGEPQDINGWQGVVESVLFLGSHSEYVVNVGGSRVLVWSMQTHGIGEGNQVWLSLDPSRVRVLADA